MSRRIYWNRIMIISTFIFMFFPRGCYEFPAIAQDYQTGWASWYSVESCKREGTSGIMANGEVLDDNKLTCASWDFDFGVLLRVVNLSNNKEIITEVKDRGPSKKLYKKGRIIDLTPTAFKAISDKRGLEAGILKIKVEKL